MPIIRPATIDDLVQLADLLAILFTQEADFTPDRDKQIRGLRAILDTPSIGQIFVACSDEEHSDKVLGMVSLLCTISTAEGGLVCWLEDMIVRPDYRGDGLGSQLLQHAVDYARRNGFLRITLLTDGTNEPAIRFYERQGFRQSEMAALRLHLR